MFTTVDKAWEAKVREFAEKQGWTWDGSHVDGYWGKPGPMFLRMGVFSRHCPEGYILVLESGEVTNTFFNIKMHTKIPVDPNGVLGGIPAKILTSTGLDFGAVAGRYYVTPWNFWDLETREKYHNLDPALRAYSLEAMPDLTLKMVEVADRLTLAVSAARTVAKEFLLPVSV